MKVCPKCNTKMERALQVMEIEADWWESEEFYVADRDGKSRIYERCLNCNTELQDWDSTISGDAPSLNESSNFRLPEGGQIQSQTRENFSDLIIEWVDVTKMSGALLGHGVQFAYPGQSGMLVGFIDGFGWRHNTDKYVKVFILTPESELWSNYTRSPKRVLRTLKECVRFILKEDKAYCGVIKGKIFCFFNA